MSLNTSTFKDKIVRDIKNMIQKTSNHEGQGLISEAFYHRNFHLNEYLQRNKDTNYTDNLQKMNSHIEKLREDIQKAWVQVPIIMPGHFKEIIAVPNSKD